MSAAAIAAVAVTVLLTSFLSGIFGMAGGLILLGVLLLMLDVTSAMILFGITQLGANGWRAYLWRGHVAWHLVWSYIAGALTVFALMKIVAFLPDKAMVYIGLGLLPIVGDVVPPRWRPDITRRFMPFTCGAFIMALQLMAGAAGSVLDIFFQKSPLDRKAIVATKAFTQVVAHVCRIAYFGTFAIPAGDVLPWWTYVGAVTLALAGTTLAAGVLHRMTDASFRRWSRWLILTVSVVYLGRGVWLLVVAAR
ncbi:MAG: TSUP family transporter [Alphaproteobacteria bacterium]|nr:TSUP family transporter [Alphaproteobacteria bacterium]